MSEEEGNLEPILAGLEPLRNAIAGRLFDQEIVDLLHDKIMPLLIKLHDSNVQTDGMVSDLVKVLTDFNLRLSRLEDWSQGVDRELERIRLYLQAKRV